MSFADKLNQITLDAKKRIAREESQAVAAKQAAHKVWLIQQTPAINALKEKLLREAESYADHGKHSFTYVVHDLHEDCVPHLKELLLNEGLNVSAHLVKTRDMTDCLVDVPELTISW